MLEWARQNSCKWDEHTCSCAASEGHLAVLQWARQNGCSWDEDTCADAAAGGAPGSPAVGATKRLQLGYEHLHQCR